MGGSATREPELIYVISGGGATYDNNSWRQRPTVLLPVTSERLLPSTSLHLLATVYGSKVASNYEFPSSHRHIFQLAGRY